MFGGYPMMGANLQNPGAGKRNEGDKWSWILQKHFEFSTNFGNAFLIFLNAF